MLPELRLEDTTMLVGKLHRRVDQGLRSATTGNAMDSHKIFMVFFTIPRHVPRIFMNLQPKTLLKTSLKQAKASISVQVNHSFTCSTSWRSAAVNSDMGFQKAKPLNGT